MKALFCMLMVIWMASLSAVAQESDLNPRTVGTWQSKGVPEVRVEVLSVEKSADRTVELSLIKPSDSAPQSIGITFLNTDGSRRLIELKAMDPAQTPVRYQGSLSKAESFVGFEIKIPFKSQKAKLLRSKQMLEVIK